MEQSITKQYIEKEHDVGNVSEQRMAQAKTHRRTPRQTLREPRPHNTVHKTTNVIYMLGTIKVPSGGTERKKNDERQ